MIDVEKVIKGSETCINRVPGEYSCAECPYESYGNDCEIQLAKDILIVLKEQEEEIQALCLLVEWQEELIDNLKQEILDKNKRLKERQR